MLNLGIYNPAIKHQKVLIKHLKKQASKRLQEKEQYGDSWKRPDDSLQDIIEDENFDPHIHMNESLQGKSFEPFRHLNKNVSATKISKNFVVFRGGKHADNLL
ncbi:cytochrome P450 [Rhizophagus clarus]|uniref:Cytochrome P450 n=1 Tax=Rhizophagus clarus TaxID=94130 RepID=A0A8H3QKK1_9GLOM|nr:cytochrome P450 [Rhizophagus clarus]